ncbi:transglycosylase SLT domain-containing protein [Metabacillus niabensis]|uniref:lytic transglycosylase domain-containing protein n=1 Tax=Metabacillus niabensis TaxID=324854 RepID=UPI0011A1B870
MKYLVVLIILLFSVTLPYSTFAVDRKDPFSIPQKVENAIIENKIQEAKVLYEESRKKEIIKEVKEIIEKERLEKEKEELEREKERLRNAENEIKTEISNRVDYSVSEVSNATTLSQEDIELITKNMSKKYDIEEKWILSVIEKESNFNANAVNENSNGTFDRGLMQINENTAKYLAGNIGINYSEGIEFNPSINIEMGTSYLASLMKNSSDIHYILTSYNRGPYGAEKLKDKQGNYESDYSRSIIEISPKYEGLLNENY